MLRPSATIALLFLASAVGAQTPPPAATPTATPGPPPACERAEFHQFDFWVGEWDVTEHGKPAGHSRIEAILKHCAIAEHWSSAQGGDGKSYNVFDVETKQWTQFWVAVGGSTLLLRGGLHDKSMVLEGEHAPAGRPSRERITWTPNADGSVRQLWEQSTDGGKTWSVAFDGLYRPSKKG